MVLIFKFDNSLYSSAPITLYFDYFVSCQTKEGVFKMTDNIYERMKNDEIELGDHVKLELYPDCFLNNRMAEVPIYHLDDGDFPPSKISVVGFVYELNNDRISLVSGWDSIFHNKENLPKTRVDLDAVRDYKIIKD
jgi:hypothetical protein